MKRSPENEGVALTVAKRQRRFRLGGVARFAVIVVAASGVVFCVWRLSLAAGNNARFKAIASRGEPVDAVELNAAYATVPENENAALVWLRGVEAMVPSLTKISNAPLGRFTLPARDQQSTDEELQQASYLVTSNEVALATFHKAATLSRSRYPADFARGQAVILSHLAPIKSAALLLQVEAYVSAQHRQPGKAAQSLTTMLSAARSLAAEPGPLSQGVRYAVDGIAFRASQCVLNRTTLTDTSLRELSAAFEEADDKKNLASILHSERAMFVTLLDRPAQMLDPSGREEGPYSETAGFFGSPLIRASGFYQRDLRYALDAMKDYIAVARFHDPQRFLARPDFDKTREKAEQGNHPMSASFLLGIQKSFIKDAEHRARARVALTVMAIERFRLEHEGRLPDGLPVLVPKYLAAAPLDPFDAQPLRFKRLEPGYVVYSIGTDEKDDGGAEPPSFKGPVFAPLPLRPTRALAGLPSGKPKPASPRDITFVVARLENP